jgi:hypothetical protein
MVAEAADAVIVLALTLTFPVTLNDAGLPLIASELVDNKFKLPVTATAPDAIFTVKVLAVTVTSPPTDKVPAAVFIINGEFTATFPESVTGLLPQVIVPVPLFIVKLAKLVGAVNVDAGKTILVLSAPLPNG